MKRHVSACDADYDVSSDPTAQQTKRQKLLEFDGNLLALIWTVALHNCRCIEWDHHGCVVSVSMQTFLLLPLVLGQFF